MASTSLEVVISARDQFTGTANRVIGSLNRMNASASRVGRGVGQVAGGLSRLAFVAGGVAAAGLIASAKAAISFEDAFAGIKKTVDETDLTKAGLSFDQLATSIRTLATDIPISANELARLGEAAGALGVAAEDIVEFSRITALLGVTTDLTSDAAATALGHIGTVLKLTGKDYENFADVLVNLGNKGASTESQIAGIAERAAGGAATIGLATNELLAWSAAIANIGVEVEAGGTNFQKILIETVKFAAEGGAELKTLAAVSGVTAAEWKKNFGTNPSSALSQFVVGLGKLSQEQQVLALGELGWDNQRVARILLGLAANTDNLSDAFVIAGASAKGAFSEEARKRFETLASMVTVLKNNLFEAALTIGEGFTPAIGRAVEKLTAFLKLDTTKSGLKKFGEDVGKALDGIDWKGVLDGAKTFVDLLKTALDVLGKLPDQIKVGGAALITAFNAPIIGPAFQQIAKGVGNIALGALGMAGSAIGGPVGTLTNLTAQPVRVVNWPLGFGAGGMAAGGAKGGLGLLGALGGVAVAGAGVALIADAVIKGIPERVGMGGRRSALSRSTTAKADVVLDPALTTAIGGLTRAMTDMDRERAAAQLATHTVLDELIGRKGGAFQRGSDNIDTAAGQLVALFQTSTNSSLKSMQENLAVMKGLAAAGDTKTRAALSGDIKALQALIDERLAPFADAMEATSSFRRGETGGNTINVAPPSVSVIVGLTLKDLVEKTTKSFRVGPSTGSAGGARHAYGTGPLQ